MTREGVITTSPMFRIWPHPSQILDYHLCLDLSCHLPTLSLLPSLLLLSLSFSFFLSEENVFCYLAAAV